MVLDEEASVDFVLLLDLYATPGPSEATAPPYSSGDLFRLVPRELGCDSRFGAMVEAEAFSAAGLIVPDSIARVYCCRQNYQHPIPSRLYRGLVESHSNAQVAGLCGPLCR